MRALLALSLLAACQADPSDADPIEEPAGPDPRLVGSVTPELAPVVAGHNALAWTSLAAVDDAPGNLFYSPFSVFVALSMVLGGAGGDTAAQLEGLLGVDDPSTWHAQVGLLLQDLGGEHHRPYTLAVANRTWGQEGLPFEADYLDLTREAYGAELAAADFEGDAEGAREEINGWVADQTHDRIPALFGEGTIGQETRFVLANAVFFQAYWATPFDPEATWSASFQRADGSAVSVPTMHLTAELRYHEDERVQVLELPYDGDEVALDVVLPRAGLTLADLAAEIEAGAIDGWVAALADDEVEVSLPTFEMGWEMPLTAALRELGVVDAFDPDRADFSGVLDPVSGRLHLGCAVHQAFVRLDEEGTEAAAATGTDYDFDTECEVDCTPVFRADRPFLFLVRDRLTGAVLFLGRMEDPSLAPAG